MSSAMFLAATLVVRTVSAVVVLSFLIGCGTGAPRSYSQFLLDTTITITTYDRLSPRTIARLFEYVADVERRMSTTESDYESTELLQVNRAAGTIPVQVSHDTFQLIRQALVYSELRPGAFDITIWPLSRIWDFEVLEERMRIPTNEEIEQARALVDYRKLRINPQNHSLYLPQQGMGIDVGAIAKGWAADRVADMLQEVGAESTLLDFGGNIVLIGKKPDNTLWRVGVQDPDTIQGTYLGVVESGAAAIVTSGDYQRFYEQQGVRYHHLLDPTTGLPADNATRSVTVISNSATDADALSTMLYILGDTEGMQLVESLPATEAIMVTADKKIVLSSGIGAQFTLTNREYGIVP